MIPIYMSVRGVFLASLVLVALGYWIVYNNSKQKNEYDMTTGVVKYYDKVFKDLPRRHMGDFRYLKIDSYPYVFEIYEPNSEETENSIDELKVGDKIKVFYYEASDVSKTGLNKYTQFIDKDDKPYFIRNSFKAELGYSLMFLAILPNIITFIYWRKGKIEW